MLVSIRTVRCVWASLIVGGGLCAACAASFSSEHLLLSTEQGVPLANQEIRLESGSVGQTQLSFSFGFETDEVLLPQIFSDSVSVGLVSEDQLTSLLLISADAGGVTWAPSNPLGTALDPTTILRTPSEPRFGPAVYQSSEAYQVSLSLPEALRRIGTTVYLDFVDNLNGVHSVGWLESVSLESSDGVEELKIYSATSVEGPFSPELNAVIDLENRLISVPLPGGQRFFRVESDGLSRVTGIRRLGDNWSVDFTRLDSDPIALAGTTVSALADPVSVRSLGLGLWEAILELDRPAAFLKTPSGDQRVLSIERSGDSVKVLLGRSPIESAPQGNGSFFPVRSFLSVSETSVRLRQSESIQFFRSTPNSPWSIQSISSDDGDVVVAFEKKQTVTRILESSRPDGVYRPVVGALRNFVTGTSFIVPEEKGNRFFKLMGSNHTIQEVWVEGEFMRIRYE